MKTVDAVGGAASYCGNGACNTVHGSHRTQRTARTLHSATRHDPSQGRGGTSRHTMPAVMEIQARAQSAASPVGNGPVSLYNLPGLQGKPAPHSPDLGLQALEIRLKGKTEIRFRQPLGSAQSIDRNVLTALHIESRTSASQGAECGWLPLIRPPQAPENKAGLPCREAPRRTCFCSNPTRVHCRGRHSRAEAGPVNRRS
jgi:hypothetical protein